MMTAIKTIRQLRKGRGWTQFELAVRLGVTPGSIYNWEHGKNQPTGRRLRKLAEVFGVLMDEIDIEGEQEDDDA